MSFSFPCLARTRFVPGACPRLRRAHLRWAIRARAVPAQGCLCRRARHPRCGLWCVGRPQSGAPRWFLGPASHLRWAIRAAAPSKSRTRRPGAGLTKAANMSPAMRPVVRRLPVKRCALLVPWPSLARTRFVSGAGFCFPGLKLGLCFLRPAAGLCLSLARRRGLFSILSNRRRLVKQCVHYRLYSFFVYINFTYPVPSLVVCGKGPSFRSGFPHFQPSFPQLLTEFFTACPPSIFENYVNLQQYNAYKREERGKALFFVNSF